MGSLRFPSHSLLRQYATPVLCLGLLGGLLAPELRAQGRTFSASLTRERQTDTLDDLGRTFEDFGNANRRTPQERRPGGGLNSPTPEMLRLRPLLTDTLNQLSDLITSLASDADRRPAVRELWVEAGRLRAQANMVVRLAGQTNDHRELTEDFRDLNAAWQTLNYELTSSRDISRGTRDLLDSLHALEEQIGQVLYIQPQVNRREMQQQLATLNTELRNIADEVRYDYGREQWAQRFIASQRRLDSQLQDCADLVDGNADRNELVESYRRFQDLWFQQGVDLQQANDRIVNRSLRNIAEADSKIRQMLQLTASGDMDKNQLTGLTAQLKSALDEFFNRTPLALLVRLPRADNALATADAFYGSCENFVDLVSRGESRDSVIDAFGEIEQYERSFAQTFRNIESDAAIAVLRDIDQAVATLRTALMVRRSSFGRQAVMDAVVELSGHAEQLQYVADRWLQGERAAFRTEASRELQSFTDQLVRFEQQLEGRISAQQAADAIEQINQQWRRVYGYLVQCQTAQRPQLGRVALRITPMLTELRTMLNQ